MARRGPKSDPKTPPPNWAQNLVKTETRNGAESGPQKTPQGRIPKRDQNGLKTLDVFHFRSFSGAQNEFKNGPQREALNGPKGEPEAGPKETLKKVFETGPKRIKNGARKGP